MYEYRDSSRQEERTTNNLPSVAMNYDGKYLEDEVIGYRTLNVTGREMIGLELESSSTQVGSIITNQTLPARTIEIQFRLEADSNNELQERFKHLMKLLYRKEDVELSFLDDELVNYYGRYSNFGGIPADTNRITSTFEIYCQDPVKYSEPVTTTGEVQISTFYDTLPEVVSVYVETAGQRLEVTNGTFTTVVLGEFGTGDTVDINFYNQSVDGPNAPYRIALNSDFENFLIEQGETITANIGTVELTVREVGL